MRIAFGFDIFYPESNGVITTTINLANNLIEMGHEVYFFVPADKNFTAAKIEKGIHIIRVKALPSFIYKGIKLLPVQSWYLRKYFAKYKFDIVHDTSPWLICQAMNHAARKMHIPVLATHHTLIDNPIYIKYALKSRTLAEAAQKPIWSIVFAPFFRLVWMVTAPNKETCESLKQHVAGIDVRYVSNGIDIDQFRKEDVYHPIAQIPKEWVNHNTFLFVGRLGFEKAIDVTLEGFAKACARRPEMRLIVIGDGPAHKELIEITKELHIEDKVLFTGKIDNHLLIRSNILKCVNSFVTSSLSENQAITVIEAICSGCPVICPDVFNMKEIVKEDSGWYFEGENPDSLAQTMIHVYDNPAERDEKGSNAKKYMDLYDGKKVAKQFESIYKELLEMKKNGFYVYQGERKAYKFEKELKDYYDNTKH